MLELPYICDNSELYATLCIQRYPECLLLRPVANSPVSCTSSKSLHVLPALKTPYKGSNVHLMFMSILVCFTTLQSPPIDNG